MPRAAPRPLAPPLFDADFGDAGLVVREHPDGLFTIDLDDARLIVNADQLQVIIGGFLRIGQTKGWT